jgi:Lipoprotein LpqB beta-propeller domain/Sporulation and spore germination
MKQLLRGAAGLFAVVLLGLLLAGGCGLRTPAGIRVDQRSVDTAADDPDIRKIPPGPAPGASAADIVRGFLEASAADADHTFAEPFLAPDVVWNDRNAAAVYQPDTLSALKESLSGSLSRVTFTAESAGVLTSAGAFLPAERLLSESYQLRRVDGQWRLSRVPPGVLLTPRDLARVYRPVRTYSFNPAGTVLVAEPGYVASDRAGLAGAALHALLTQWNAQSASKVSASRSLATGLSALGSVVVQNGQATVDLGREAFNIPTSQRPLLVSQIAASLASVPGVFTVRVLVEERPLVGGPVEAAIPANLLPDVTGPTLAFATDGTLEELTSNSSRAVTWVGKDGTPQGLLTDPVSAPGGTALAALRQGPSGLQLVIADLRGSSAPTATQRRVVSLPASSGGREMRPQWLDGTRIMLAVGGIAPRLELVDAATGALRSVAAPGLAGLGPLSSFSVSRDGTRATAVSGVAGARQVYLGRILSPTSGPVTTEGTTVSGWTAVPTGMADVVALSWSGDLELTLLGRPASQPPTSAAVHAEVVALDGVSDPTPLPALPADLEALVAVPERPLVSASPARPTMIGIGTRRWLLEAGRWVPRSPARDPSYP